jgi:hypothetical protein
MTSKTFEVGAMMRLQPDRGVVGEVQAPDQIELAKLQQILAEAQAAHERMKKANILVRKNDKHGLAALGFDEAQVNQIMRTDYKGRAGFPKDALDSSSRSVRRLVSRIANFRESNGPSFFGVPARQV